MIHPFALKEHLYDHVDFLTSIYPYRNYKNTESLKKAANYIHGHFTRAGLETSFQQWTAAGNFYENVIGSYNPQHPVRLIVGAHYDCYYDQPGADDNASGVATILELGRMICQQNPALDYGIDLISFCLEEPPFFRKKEMGSYVHAKSVSGQSIMGMVSLEMVGYYSGTIQNGDERELMKDLEESAFLVVAGIEKFSEFNIKVAGLLRERNRLGIKRITFSDTNPNNGPSDHRNYWKFGIPGVMVIGGKKNGNPNYHKPSDTIETLNFEAMAATTDSCYHLITNWK